METLWQDLRFSLRMLVKRPSFTAIAVIALALGIGANSAIFSLVNTVLLRPLPYQDPERLVLIWTKFLPDLPQNWVSGPEVVDFRERSKSFEGIAILSWPTLGLTGSGEPEQIQAGAVTANLFPLLGVAPSHGRAIRPEEDQPNGERVVVLSHGLWQRRFGGDPNIVGRTIALNNQASTVVGIMPPDFGVLPPDAQSPKQVDLWVPMQADFRQMSRGSHFLRAIARLQPNVTLDQARAEMDAVAEQMDQEFYHNFGFGVTVVPLHGHTVRHIQPALLVLLGAVAFVLLIACANVANLLLASAVTREKEIAIRTALGAGRRRIIRQLLSESIMLGLAGGLVGLLLAYFGLKGLVALSPENIPRLDEVSIDLRVLGFTLLIAVLTGIMFGLVPALQASKSDLNEALKESGRGTSGGARGKRLRGALVVAEVALALVLLTGAGLMIRSFLRLQEVNPGFNPAQVLTMRLQLPASKYPSGQPGVNLFQGLLERVRALPGVDSAGLISSLPLSGSYSSGTVTVENPPPDTTAASFEADWRTVTPDYFRAMNVPLLRGRDFTLQDSAEATPTIIIDEKFAQRFWPNEDPLGKRIKRGGRQANTPWLTVIGVVGHTKDYGLNEEGREHAYFPHPQSPARSMFLTVRTSGDPSALINTVRNTVWAIDPAQPMAQVQTMAELVYSSVAQPRFNMLLLVGFAAVAMILAAVGIYGVMNYSISQRTHEIGIRVALGAPRRTILTMVLAQGLMLVLGGIGLGVLGAYAVTHLMASLLFGVSATDPMTFSLVALVLIGVALLASYIPARRAMKVDPMIALRYE